MFVARFGAVMIVLYVIVALNPVNDRVIVPFTELVARSSAAVLRLSDGGIESVGTVIHSPRFAIDVRNGCNGIEAVARVALVQFYGDARDQQAVGLNRQARAKRRRSSNGCPASAMPTNAVAMPANRSIA